MEKSYLTIIVGTIGVTSTLLTGSLATHEAEIQHDSRSHALVQFAAEEPIDEPREFICMHNNQRLGHLTNLFRGDSNCIEPQLKLSATSSGLQSVPHPIYERVEIDL